jgi:hypothetical protein
MISSRKFIMNKLKLSVVGKNINHPFFLLNQGNNLSSLDLLRKDIMLLVGVHIYLYEHGEGSLKGIRRTSDI